MNQKFFYRKKKTKDEDLGSNIIFFQIHSSNDPPQWNDPYWRIVSIDPGKINLALRIEKRFNDGRIEVEVFEKININTYNNEQDKEISSNNLNNKDNDNKNFNNNNDLYFKSINILNTFYPYFIRSHLFIIERQILPNYAMIRLSQHFITYFSLLLKNTSLKPLLLEVEPGFKNRFFKMPRGINSHAWVVEKAFEILNLRHDLNSLNILRSHKGRKDKNDDLAVVIVQIEAVLQSLQWSRPYPV